MIAVTKRNAALGEALRERRRELERDLRQRVRTGRAESSGDVGDAVDRSDANTQRDIESALLQLRTETLSRIDAALVRLDSGKYGFCLECEDAIAVRRLRALPFAVRCQSCEEAREQAQGLARQADRQTDPLLRFPPVLGS